MNISDPVEDILPTLNSYGVELNQVDVVACHMAIHYFLPTINNFISLVSSLVKPQGKFFYTCFNGKKIFDLLKQSKGDFQVLENGVLKYRIVAEYDWKKMKTYTPDKKLIYIKVLMPFSNGKLYLEPLVDIDWLNDKFKTAGFTLIEQKENKDGLVQLSENDRFYASLYSGCCLEKE